MMEDALRYAGRWGASLGLLVMLACGGGRGGTGPTSVARVTVTLTATRLTVGQTTSATATVSDAQGNVLSGRSIAWESSNTAVATVSGSGTSVMVTAVAQGTATISATSEGVTGSGPDLLVAPPFALVEISAGYQHTCGRTSDGTAYCWGFNQWGQLGDGTTADRFVPTLVSGGLNFAGVSAGGVHTCGRTTDGAAYCWGGNGEGELGDGTTTGRLVPTPVSGGLSFVELSTGGEHTCGRTSTLAGYCWGLNFSGEVGDGSGAVFRLVPSPVSGGLSFVQLSSGGFHNCGLANLGAAHCWGENRYGRLGNGTTNSAVTPVPVSGGLSFVELSAGNEHTCGRTSTGTAYCWGLNVHGQLGDGSREVRLVPSQVAPPAG